MDFWHDIGYFFSMQDPNVRAVTFGSALVAGSSALVGAFAFFQRKSLAGDAVSHAILPGICLVYLITLQKDPAQLMVGAFAAGMIAWVLIDRLSGKSILKPDTVISLVLSTTFGLGIVLLTYIQADKSGNQSGLDRFLFGKAAALVGKDLYVFGSMAVLTVALVVLLFRGFITLSFDRSYGQLIGMPVKGLQAILTMLTVMAVVLGIQSVGVVLMSAVLITPAAAARYLTMDNRHFLILAVLIGAMSGVVGALVSYLIPSLPTGPSIVITSSGIAFLSFLFAPKRGVVYILSRRARQGHRVAEENLLKLLYNHQAFSNAAEGERATLSALTQEEGQARELRKGARSLTLKGQVYGNAEKGWRLTEAGQVAAKRIVRLHRLWELYLSEQLSIAADHVHDDAETMEHIITPEIEERLLEILNRPTTDPHGEPIPR